MSDNTTVYYLAPDYDTPSWGNGILYSHVKLLNNNGINARVLHHNPDFKYSWFESNVPISYLNEKGFEVNKEDYLVVPEVNILDKEPKSLDCNKIAFIQGGFLILHRLDKARDFSEMGYDNVIVTMPNIKEIADSFFGTDAAIVPAFVAPYFYSTDIMPPAERKKRIVIFQNPAYGKFNFIDYDILTKILVKNLGSPKNRITKFLSRGKDTEWEFLELKDYSHETVSDIMKESAFFVNLNCLEGFNVTVVEAMAAGCIVLCYEAYCGKDFLKDKENAYVFPNNYVYPLLKKLFKLTDNFDNMHDEMNALQKNAYKTALRYTEEETERALVSFYSKIL